MIVFDLVAALILAYALTRHSTSLSHSAVASRHTAQVAVGRSVARSRPQVVEPQPGQQATPSRRTHGRSTRGRTAQRLRSSIRPAATAASGDPLRPGAAASFAQLQDSLGNQAQISVAIEPLGSETVRVLGADPAMLGMSTTKVLVLASLLRDRGGASHLTDTQRALAQSAITESDNQSILDLFGALEADQGGLAGASNYMTGVLRDAGDSSTVVATAPPPAGYATTFGQTPWTPAAEVTFFRSLALGCLLSPSDTSYVLGLMREIVPSERWGLGSAGFSAVAFKGGWGPLAGGYGVRQTGIIGSGHSGVVVAMTADPATTFAAGTSALTDVAQWVAREIRLMPRAPGSCAGQP